MNILVIEDEHDLAAFLKTVLERNGYAVTLLDSIEEAIQQDYASSHDLVVLDLILKGEGGEVFVRRLRQEGNSVPILILSALGQIRTKIDLINLGADDYLTKPFDEEELIVRIKALHRRSHQNQIDFLDEEVFGAVKFYPRQCKLVREGKEIVLTRRESELFTLLLQKRGHVVSFDELLKKVWKARPGYQSNVVQATVRRLRNKVDFGFTDPLIQNIHGVGYTLNLLSS